MKLTTFSDGTIQIDDARIVYRNFEGRKSMYNNEGDRNFSVVIPNQELADELINLGWNVKIKPPMRDGDEPFRTLPVKVKFNNYGPNIYLKIGKKQTRLTESTAGKLDQINILSVDLDLRPYDWERPDGRSGRTAYLSNIRVYQQLDRFATEEEDEDDIQIPWE